MSEPERRLEETLRRAAQGDEDAWREIAELYSPRVYGLIRAQCGSDDLAEEISQSTFCTVVQKLDSYTEIGRFESWLFRIATNRLRDEMRRRKRQATPTDDDVLAGMAPPVTDAAREDRSVIDADSPAGALRRAMSQLPDADRRVVHLRHYGELAFRQIADVLDQPLGTVLARHHRALKKLKDLLGGVQGDQEGESAGPGACSDGE